MGYNFTISHQVAQWRVEIDPVKRYGYFESQVTGSGGGLWFDKNAAGLVLADYDGVYELGRRVVLALDDLGVYLAPEFLPEAKSRTLAGAQHAAQFLADEYGHAWVDEYCGLFEAHGEVDAADIPVNNLGVFTRQS